MKTHLPVESSELTVPALDALQGTAAQLCSSTCWSWQWGVLLMPHNQQQYAAQVRKQQQPELLAAGEELVTHTESVQAYLHIKELLSRCIISKRLCL